MSWAEVKKLNNNITLPLDELFWKYLTTGYEDFLYSSSDYQDYEIPFDGYFTIRAFCGTYGSYGKVCRRFSKGDKIRFLISDSALTASLLNTSTNDFSISLSKNSELNSLDDTTKFGLTIGGAWFNSVGGSGTIRCNNGIAVGAGGSGGISINSSNIYYGTNGFNGGNAYAWGNNVYALGGGGSGSTVPYYDGNETNNALYNYGIGGYGGNAFINGIEIEDYCEYNRLNNIKSGRGYGGINANTYSSTPNSQRLYPTAGGNGGCGGSLGIGRNNITYSGSGGMGYFGNANKSHTGASARGGSAMQGYSNPSSQLAGYGYWFKATDGYFAGGNTPYYDYANNTSRINGANGGWQGSNGGNGRNYSTIYGGHGGSGKYGIGGCGGNGYVYYTNSSSYTVCMGNGGDGYYFGGDAGGICDKNTSPIIINTTLIHSGSGIIPGRCSNEFSAYALINTYGNYINNVRHYVYESSFNVASGEKITDKFVIKYPDRTKSVDNSIVIITYGQDERDF